MSTDSTNSSNNATSTAAEPSAADAAAPAPTPPTIVEAAASVATSRRFKTYYTKLKPHWLLIAFDDAMRITVDVGYVIQSTYGILSEVEKIWDDIHRECPTLSPTLIQDLREGIGGLAYCEMLKRGAGDSALDHGSDPVLALRTIRDQLVSDAQPLVARGYLSPADLTLSQGNSPRNVAFDVMKFATKIGDNIQHLEGRSMITPADLDAAAKAAEDLLEFLGIKEKAQESAEEVTLTRQRSMTYAYELYEELRWGVRFTRRKQKDADVIMPSLFTLRTKKASRDNVEPEQPATPGTPAAPTETNPATAGLDLAHLQAIMSGGVTQPTAPVAPAPTVSNGVTSPSGNNPTGAR